MPAVAQGPGLADDGPTAPNQLAELSADAVERADRTVAMPAVGDGVARTEAMPEVGGASDPATVFVPAPGEPPGPAARAAPATTKSPRARKRRGEPAPIGQPTPAFGAMGAVPTDWRLAPPDWRPAHDLQRRRRILRFLVLVDLVLAGIYMWWLVQPGRSAHLGLYVLLLAAELFNLVQGLGFWWTMAHLRPPPRVPARPAVSAADTAVDVLIPTYDEPVEIVEPTVAAAMALRGGDVRVALLDDGGRPEMEEMARRLGAAYFARKGSAGAKAGNINEALGQVDAPFVAVLDCDHVPDPAFLEVCLAHFADNVAFVQTPQYYANWRRGGVTAASWSQQALFFGTIAVGRDALGAMFCCGTNVVFRREALDEVGGFSLDSLTEDFELSIRLHEKGWRTRYVPEVLTSGLGPEDMASYVSQQLRWARGCLAALPQVVKARLPMRLRLQYLLSGAYWLTGWTLVVYMLFPIVRILFGEQPIVVSSPEEFLVHWGPYFLASMLTVTVASGGRYSWSAFALMSSSFWIHVVASVLTLGRRKGSFAVTPKQGIEGRQVRPVLVPLGVVALLVAVAAYGLLRDRSPATVTNASFAFVHVAVLAGGIRYALQRPTPIDGSARRRPAPAGATTGREGLQR
jgi:cellulose synthase (UDP-forming)